MTPLITGISLTVTGIVAFWFFGKKYLLALFGIGIILTFSSYVVMVIK